MAACHAADYRTAGAALRALASHEALRPRRRPAWLPLNNLAGLYQATGRYEEAEPLYRRAVAILEQALGPEHRDVAYYLDRLAGLYQATGRYEEAEPLYRRALVIWEQALGPEHRDVASASASWPGSTRPPAATRGRAAL